MKKETNNMALFFKLSEKEILTALNKVFQEKGIPVLVNNGFVKSPFIASWYGKNNLGGYTYDLCRLVPSSELQCITTYMSKKDYWIQTFLNIFQLYPNVNEISDLYGLSGAQFRLPPNTITKMRLKIDGYKVMPLLRDLFVKQHKLRSYYTKSGFEDRLLELGSVLEEDLNNIDHFVKMWHELHKPLITDWDGRSIPQLV